MVQDMLKACTGTGTDADTVLPFPPSIEQACAPEMPGLAMIQWALFQLGNLLARPVQFPQSANKRVRYTTLRDPDARSTVLDTFTLPAAQLGALRDACRTRGLTVTQVLDAAMLCATAGIVSDEQRRAMNLRCLLSVGLRPFGKDCPWKDFTGGTVACAGGAVDFIVPVPASAPEATADAFWALAATCRDRAKQLMDCNFVPESVRLFDLGIQYAEVLRIVDKDAESGTLGRGFSCGVSNVGMCDFDFAHQGELQVDGVFYGTSHARNGVLCQLSVETVKASGSLCDCLQMTDPLTTRDVHSRRLFSAFLRRGVRIDSVCGARNSCGRRKGLMYVKLRTS